MMPPMLMPLPPPDLRRLVLAYTTGKAKDTEQIIGLTDQQPGSYLELEMADGTRKGFSLIRATGRAVYYREIVAPNGGLTEVDKAQQ